MAQMVNIWNALLSIQCKFVSIHDKVFVFALSTVNYMTVVIAKKSVDKKEKLI